MTRSSRKSTINEIRKHSRQLVRELDVVRGVYLGTGYTLTQCHVLFELAANGKLGLMELAAILLINKSNTSRTVKRLVELGLVKTEKTEDDNRKKMFSLTTGGQSVLARTVNLADVQVESAISVLSRDEQETVIEGLKLYGDALRKGRLQSTFGIRKIRRADSPAVAKIIREVMTEFGAVGEGYSITDPEVDDMYANYRDKRSCYLVVVQDEKIMGCGGLAPLEGGKTTTCELRKMFFLPQARGFGMGRRMLAMLMKEARKRGFTECYIETLQRMKAANTLYRNFGFEPVKRSLGNTGHARCDSRYLLKL